jgi:hypothetical protein
MDWTMMSFFLALGIAVLGGFAFILKLFFAPVYDLLKAGKETVAELSGRVADVEAAVSDVRGDVKVLKDFKDRMEVTA